MDAETKATLADVYEKAAEYLEEYGWTQRTLGNDGGPRCMMGGIYSVTDTKTYFTAAKFICQALEIPLRNSGRGGAEVADWNDDPSRTADEVINTLHALANKLR